MNELLNVPQRYAVHMERRARLHEKNGNNRGPFTAPFTGILNDSKNIDLINHI